jgi:DNA repair exonuclease SbcCD ATPase subunit
MDDEHQPASSNDAALGTPAVPDERDATIERLERAIAEERQHSAALRTTIEELRFQLDILERSYSKQLADARQRGETAEQEATDLRARVSELEAAHEQAVRKSAESPSRDGNLTINELIDGAAWAPERRPAGYEEDIVRTEQDTPAEEMIAPDLVFTNERDGS